MRTPRYGETWVYKPCEFHNQLRDVVWIGRSFEDQPERLRQYELGRLYCGCFYAADDPEAAIAELREWERLRSDGMRLNKSNSRIPKVEPSRDWGLIAGMALAMLGLIGMLVFLTQK
jgi:hypothetical protein